MSLINAFTAYFRHILNRRVEVSMINFKLKNAWRLIQKIGTIFHDYISKF